VVVGNVLRASTVDLKVDALKLGQCLIHNAVLIIGTGEGAACSQSFALITMGKENE